jgi:hypothetical protein
LVGGGHRFSAENADGARLSLEFTVVRLKDAGGQIGGVAAVMRDVIARFEEMRELKRRISDQ